MKSITHQINKVIVSFIVFTVFIPVVACSDFLDEKPLDFKSSSNSFTTVADFEKSLVYLYAKVREEFYSGDEQHVSDYLFGCDLVWDGQIQGSQRFNDYANTCNPSNSYLDLHWQNFYKIISECNTIISRVEKAPISASDKLRIEATARFFRGFGYRCLSYLYGGVPLELNEVADPKTDYVRADKNDVLKCVKEDLVFASENLPSIKDVRDGEVSDMAAYHLLAEVELALGEFEAAYKSASYVIDSPEMSLMSQRFGSLKDEDGDVYYDLFRSNNQNRSSGNTEAIWVIQYETGVVGGHNDVTSVYGSGYKLERLMTPLVRDLRVDGERVSPFLWPASTLQGGGRGVGWGIPTRLFSNTIWETTDWNDMRNSNFNVHRKFYCDNPASKFYGRILDTENPPAGVTVPCREWYPYSTKCTTPGQHPENLLDSKTGLLTGNAGFTYTDQYLMRMAETYLIRAEASLGMNKKSAAAADINVVRARANAKPCSENEVTIDYLLDERMRELGLEEKRRLTLGRLGDVYRRTVIVAQNPLVRNMAEHHNLWPIPYSEIERNKDAKLEQNPGY